MDLRMDADRFRKHARKHLTSLPDELKGQQLYINDLIDGLITGATGSPFTTLILPYMYHDAPDSKIKWRVWSFDEVCGCSFGLLFGLSVGTLQRS